MPSKIVSFGFKHNGGRPPTVGPDAMVIDIRRRKGIRNPWHVPGLQARHGLDQDVQAYMCSGPGFHDAMAILRHEIRNHPGPVYVGCQGGRHRSVYVAELLGGFYEVSVEHLDITE